MKVTTLQPKPESKVWFRLSASGSLPNEPGCYVLTNAAGDVLYLGLTLTLRSRFEQHLDTPVKIEVTPDGKAQHFYYYLCNELKLEFIERSWLEQFRTVHGRFPVLNKVSSPVH